MAKQLSEQELLRPGGERQFRACGCNARQTHRGVDYERLAAPYLLQIQERQQEVLDYLSAKPKPADV